MVLLVFCIVGWFLLLLGIVLLPTLSRLLPDSGEGFGFDSSGVPDLITLGTGADLSKH